MFDNYSIDKDKVVHRLIGDEAVLLNLDNGSYYNINEVGTQIWEQMSEGKSICEIVLFIAEEYSLSEERAEKDLLLFLKVLEKNALIKRV